ncbi:phosphopentomutase [hydrocarbon metagenome]|uniref:Phosphopentomutase n=1 Tax=hydrocarbon metagenome TaxID=938273 RepID=A0A0W8G063_9ZZZZ
MNNFFIIILDGVGIGELPDAYNYSDQGSNTLANIAKSVGGLNLPNLNSLGLGNISEILGLPPSKLPLASYGKMREVSKGKDSTTGHWEIAGLKLNFDFPYYPNGFPDEVIEHFKQAANLKGVLGNKPASGTAIIDELGDEHIKTGYPIVYTSADSVFQIATHEEVIPLDKLYEICQIARDQVLVDEHSVGRVIARPFIGETGNYNRTTNRKDFSLDPPSDTILNVLQKNGIETVAIGKINDLFNYNGIDVNEKTKSNAEGMSKLIHYASAVKNSFVFINLVDFDVYFGHRNDPVGFSNALKEFDDWLPAFLSKFDETDAMIITADHGNDPTTKSTDHSREYVPVLFYRKNKAGRNLGIRESFSDAAQTVAHFFRINNNLEGKSFLNE